MYKIGDFSRLCRVSVKTLRYYDDLGILKPDFIDKYTGYRYYQPSKLSQVYKILALKELGFSLEEIGDFLQKEGCEGVDELLSRKGQELAKQLNEIQSKISKLDALSKAMSQEGENLSGNVIVKQNDPIRIASIRGLVKDRSEIRKIADQIKDFLNENNVKYSDLCIVINFDTEYCTENMDLEIGVQILTQLSQNDVVKERIIKIESKTASIICQNTEEDIEKAYASLAHYNENNRYQVIGAFYEYYHDNNTIELQVPVYKLLDRRLTEPRNDDINIPFENDEDVIGKWEVIDCLPTKEHFNPEKIKHTRTHELQEIYFLPDGEEYWCYGWTKGYLKASYGDNVQVLCRYSIQDINGYKYMFVDFKDANYYFYGGMHEILVLRQVDNIHHTKDEIRVYDRTDYLFVPDDVVLGRWISVDFVREIEDFNPQSRSYVTGDLYFKYAHFKENGEYEVQFGDKVYGPPAFTWTKGLTLEHSLKTAPAYIIKRICGSDYLFIEWKSGDYYFARRKPYYYVFRRAE